MSHLVCYYNIVFASIFKSAFGAVISCSVHSQQHSISDVQACPLSSYIPPEGGIPVVYGLNKDTFIIANTETGDIQQFSVKYENTPVTVEEPSSEGRFDSPFKLPDLSRYRERTLRAVFSAGDHKLYQMDDEIGLSDTLEKT